MVVGSKVRMLHGIGEGIVTKINGDQAVVLLNEGLEIPLRRQDLVVIATREESRQIEKHDPKAPPMFRPVSRMFFVKDGIFLAGFARTPMLLDFSVVNHTHYKLIVVLYKLGKPTHQFLTKLEIEPNSAVDLPEPFPMQETNHLVGLAFQMVRFHPDQGEMAPVKEFRFSFSQVDWKKTITKIPILEKEGYLIQLDGEPVKLDPVKLKDAMLTHRPEIKPPQNQPTKRIEFREIDLHIEKLRPDYGDLPANQILDIQLVAFDKAFDQALVDMVHVLVVIHGVGGGILKEEIHKRLSRTKQIKHYKEARKEKFGYGATEITF